MASDDEAAKVAVCDSPHGSSDSAWMVVMLWGQVAGVGARVRRGVERRRDDSCMGAETVHTDVPRCGQVAGEGWDGGCGRWHTVVSTGVPKHWATPP